MSHRTFSRTASRLISTLLCSCLCLFMFQPTAVSAEGISGQLEFAEGNYRINVGDTLNVNVYNQPDLSSSGVVVRPDGMASFQGIGELLVAGKTIRNASQMISGELRELVKDPRVTLNVIDGKAPSVYLAGAVMHPGMMQSGNSSYSFEGETQKMSSGSGSNSSRMDFRISNILSTAGGVKMTADLSNVQISRDGQPYRSVNLWNMIRNGDTTQDIMLQSGDSIYIPELAEQALDDASYRLLLSSTIGPRTFPVRVIGEVKTPGVLELSGNSPYLDSAIAKGGGFSPSANKQVIAIRRFTGETKFTTFFVNPNKFDFVLRPNDVVYVSELKLYKTGRFAEEVSRILSPFNTVASTGFSYALLKQNF